MQKKIFVSIPPQNITPQIHYNLFIYLLLLYYYFILILILYFKKKKNRIYLL